jgi:hypothetical protein
MLEFANKKFSESTYPSVQPTSVIFYAISGDQGTVSKTSQTKLPESGKAW